MNKTTRKKMTQAILYQYPVGTPINNESHTDFLMSIFENHPEWEIKKGVGVASISVRPTKYKGVCFYLTRLDGSETDISFIQCIDGKNSKRSDVRCACRTAIRPAIVAFRNQNVIYGVSTCPITGEVLTKENTHIDHYDLTFEELFAAWVEKHGGIVEELHGFLNNSERDGETEIYFEEKEFADDFLEFHNENTHLRAVSNWANLSVLKRKVRWQSPV